MKKLAIFVEGLTEQIFFERFLVEIAGRKHIVVDSATASKNVLAALQLRRPAQDVRYFVLLMNCQNDERVKSVILERRTGLEQAGYSLVLGVRDLYPAPLADLNKVKQGLLYGMPTKGIPTHVLLAVAEIEAWFLQEETHYSRIDPLLIFSTFKARFGFDPVSDSAEAVAQPSAVLQAIYNSVGKGYTKTRLQIKRTVDALDCDHLYADLPPKLPHLRDVVAHLDSFFQ